MAEQITLSDVRQDITDEQARRLIALLGLGRPREQRAA